MTCQRNGNCSYEMGAILSIISVGVAIQDFKPETILTQIQNHDL